MSYRYTPAEIEPKWQTVWEEQGLYKTREDQMVRPDDAALSVRRSAHGALVCLHAQ